MASKIGIIFGLACLWLCYQCDIYFPLTYAPGLVNAGTYTAAAFQHCLFVLICLLAMAFVVRFRAMFAFTIERRRLAPAIVGTLGLATSCVLALTDPAAPSAPLLYGVGMSIGATWISSATLMWTSFLIRSDARSIPLFLFGGFGASLAVYAIIAATGLDKACTLLPAPALSGYMLFFTSGSPSQPSNQSLSTLRELPLNLLIPAFFLAVCATASVRLMSPTPTAGGPGSTLVTTAFTAVVFAAMLMVASRSKGNPAETDITLFAVLAAMLVLGLVLSVALEERQFPVSPRRFIVAAEHCLELYMSYVIAHNARQKRLSPMLCSCMFLLLGTILPRFAGSDLVFFLTDTSGSEVSSNALVAIVCAFLVFGITVWGLLTAMRGGGRANPDEDCAALEGICERIGQTCSLSKREIEVAVCLCRGMPQKAIAEKMMVAESTIKTHVKHLYTKLGVHSRQELMEVAEGYR